jgi:hypothetical protein
LVYKKNGNSLHLVKYTKTGTELSGQATILSEKKSLDFNILNLYKVGNKYIFFEVVNEFLDMIQPHIFYAREPMGSVISMKAIKPKFLSKGRYLNSYNSHGNLIVELLSTDGINSEKLGDYGIPVFGPLRITTFISRGTAQPTGVQDDWSLYFKNMRIGMLDPLAST